VNASTLRTTTSSMLESGKAMDLGIKNKTAPR